MKLKSLPCSLMQPLMEAYLVYKFSHSNMSRIVSIECALRTSGPGSDALADLILRLS